jgi:hypothetical protein
VVASIFCVTLDMLLNGLSDFAVDSEFSKV